tara:strand:- start:284 stop:469 length:186 start_codon:yes stop_codon:yes gene_type:complete
MFDAVDAAQSHGPVVKKKSHTAGSNRPKTHEAGFAVEKSLPCAQLELEEVEDRVLGAPELR